MPAPTTNRSLAGRFDLGTLINHFAPAAATREAFARDREVLHECLRLIRMSFDSLLRQMEELQALVIAGGSSGIPIFDQPSLVDLALGQYQLSQTPSYNTAGTPHLLVFKNGVLQAVTTDFTLTADIIQFVPDAIPRSGDSVTALIW